MLQLPHHSLAYSEEAGAVVLTCYAGDYQRQEGGGLPVAQSFSTYWERTAEAQRNGKVGACAWVEVVFCAVRHNRGAGCAVSAHLRGCLAL